MRALLISLCLALSIYTFGQDTNSVVIKDTSKDIIQHKKFLMKPVSAQQIEIFEASIQSEYLGKQADKVDRGYFMDAIKDSTYHPMIFIRKSDPFFPYMHVRYYTSSNDSILYATSHKWDIMEYITNLREQSDMLEEQVKRKKEYIEKYDTLKQNLIAKYGDPLSVEELKDETGLKYTSVWSLPYAKLTLHMLHSSTLNSVAGIKLGSFEIEVIVDYYNGFHFFDHSKDKIVHKKKTLTVTE